MTLLTSLQTLFRASVREATEKITDANAVRIYRQDIVDAQNLLAQRKLGLAAMIACRKDLENEIASAKARAQRQEDALQRVPVHERNEDLLLIAATDIAAQQALADELSQRHLELSRRINAEEITLRKLKNEIRDHSREARILQSQIATSRSAAPTQYENTVAAQVAILRETRASLATLAPAADINEASVEEMIERVEETPLQRAIKSSGKTDRDLMINQVLSRLKTMGEAG
jgi:hypothetical protein